MSREDAPKASGDELAGAGARPVRSRRRDAMFALVALVAILLLVEAGLRIVGFRFTLVPVLVDETYGDKQIKAMNESSSRDLFQPDPLLFYSMKPGAKTPDGRTVNELGLANEPVEIPKPDRTVRILCLGDSCTAGGPISYAEWLARMLKRIEEPEHRFDVVNAGVYSYTSLQGLRLFQHRLAELDPDLVTVYYGWNDHYLTYGDPDKLLRSPNAVTPPWMKILRSLRTYQLVLKTVNEAQLRAIKAQRVKGGIPRVSPADYRNNLAAIVNLAHKRGARTLLLTAPSNHSPGRVPSRFIKDHMALDGDDLIRRHAHYNEIVRELSREENVALLDLVARFRNHDKDSLFVADGVHFSARGRWLVGKLLLEKASKMGIAPAGRLAEIPEMRHATSLTPERLRSRVEFADSPVRAPTGRPVVVRIRIANTGDTIWLKEGHNGIHGMVRIGARVLAADGREILSRDQPGRGRLPRDVGPGESVEVDWSVPLGAKPGRYILEVDPVVELIGWFDDMGDGPSTVSLVVDPLPKTSPNAR